MLRYISSIPTLMRFYHEWMLNFVKCFFCICWNYYVTFILLLFTVVYRIDWFTNVKPSLHPWNKSSLMMVYDCFYVLLDSVCFYLVEDFCIYIHWRYWPAIWSFVVVVSLCILTFCLWNDILSALWWLWNSYPPPKLCSYSYQVFGLTL